MCVAPCEADAPLVIDANAVLAFTVAFQTLEAVSRQCRECSDIRRGVEHVQFSQGRALNGFEPAHGFAVEKALGIGAAKKPDHRPMVYCYPVNGKQYRWQCWGCERRPPEKQAAATLRGRAASTARTRAGDRPRRERSLRCAARRSNHLSARKSRAAPAGMTMLWWRGWATGYNPIRLPFYCPRVRRSRTVLGIIGGMAEGPCENF